MLIVLLLLTFSLLRAKNNYGNIGMAEIIFHLNMPLRGTSKSLLAVYGLNALLPTALIFGASLACFFFIKPALSKWLRGKQMAPAGILFPLVWFGLLLVEADQSFALKEYIAAQLNQSHLIEDEYVNPAEVAIAFPEQKGYL